ncbi:TPA: hypothetical protein ACJOUO_001636, partial [Streptococcus pyogenes]
MDFLTGDFPLVFRPMYNPHRYTISQDNQALEKVKQASYKRMDIAMTHLDGLIGEIVGMFIEINKPLQMLMLTPWRYGLKKHQNLTRIIRI